MKWTETKYMPALPKIPSTLTFKFDNIHPRNEDFVINQKIIKTEMTNQIEKLLWCKTDFRTKGLI